MTESDDATDRTGDAMAPETGDPDPADQGRDTDDADPGEPELFGGDKRAPEPVEPGSPTLENAAFVALGVASMIVLVGHLLSLL